MVYLIHFDRPFSHARHYVGFVHGGRRELALRVARHAAGDGAKILRAVTAAGIGWRVVRTWGARGTRAFERGLKNAAHPERVCPCCGGRRQGRRMNVGKGLGFVPSPEVAQCV